MSDLESAFSTCSNYAAVVQSQQQATRDANREHRRKTFAETFPEESITFDDLRPLYEGYDGCEVSTDDGCDHYQYKNKVFTYDWADENKWIKKEDK